jgi:hypothetical protein
MRSILALSAAILGLKLVFNAILDSYTNDMRICSQDCTKTSLMSLKLAFILLTI